MDSFLARMRAPSKSAAKANPPGVIFASLYLNLYILVYFKTTLLEEHSCAATGVRVYTLFE
jgi:hypothetical protein